MSAQVKQVIRPLATTALFCKDCGMMLHLDSHSPKSECKFCHKVTDISEMIKSGQLATEQSLAINQRKEWMIEENKGDSERPTAE